MQGKQSARTRALLERWKWRGNIGEEATDVISRILSLLKRRNLDLGRSFPIFKQRQLILFSLKTPYGSIMYDPTKLE